MVTPAHIVPEWYLLPFYAILRSVPDKLLGVCGNAFSYINFGCTTMVRYFKNKISGVQTLYINSFYWILVADVLILGYMGAMPAEGLYLLIARVATAYYFLHFLVILPVLGFKEKTLPIPLSITEPVLGGSPNLAMAKNKESIDK
jgi:ubiquinol-cytochrome c reductase cytochrome b subunit